MPNSIRIVREFQDIILSEASIRWGEDFTVKDVVYTLIDISIKHNISEKQCRNIIYKQRYKFLKESNIR